MGLPGFKSVAAVILVALPLLGCADFHRDIYGGLRARSEAMRQPAGDSRAAMPDYDAYQREREKLKKQQRQAE